MEPGEYLTNVLSSNEFTSIKYEYFEPHSLSVWDSRKCVQQVEATWRLNNRITVCDPHRDGIWLFEKLNSTISDHCTKEGENLSPSVVEVQGVELVQRDRGIFEPANLARSKSALSNNLSTPTSGSSPSSSLETALRNSQTHNARSAQTNALLNVGQEPQTPSPGTKADHTPSQKDIHEYFISAVLGSLVYTLSRDYGLLPLNSRTLVLTGAKILCQSPLRNWSTQCCNAVELVTLDVALTSLGSLVVKGVIDPAPGLHALVNQSNLLDWHENLLPGVSLWLAPSGSAAKFHSVPDEDRIPNTTSIAKLQASPRQSKTGFNAISIKSWQSKCLEWLSMKGLDTVGIESGGWAFVQILEGQSPYSSSDYQSIPMLEDLTTIPWPAMLCFQVSHTNGYVAESPKTSDNPVRDPLSFAEDWYRGRDERVSVSSKRQRERQMAEALSKEQADIDSRATQNHTYSPTALRRGSNAGAMYPTPPDAPQHLVGVTPTFDGNGSTPVNQNLHAYVEPATAGPPTHSTSEVDVEMWDAGKKEQPTSLPIYQEAEADNENLFGDLGGDLFGTDITDADFSFFDEPDVLDFDPKQPSPLPLNSIETKASEDIDLKQPANNLVHNDHHQYSLSTPASEFLDHLDHPDPSIATKSCTDLEIQHSPKKISVKTAVKTASPRVDVPFDKETVFRRLVYASTNNTPERQQRRASQFDKINFENSLQAVNRKYDAHGSFSFKVQKHRSQENFRTLPQTDYLNRRRKPNGQRAGMGHIARILAEKDTLHQASVDEPMDYLLEANLASPVSEQDDSSHTTDNGPLPQMTGAKRKWEDTTRDDITLSFDALAVDMEHPLSTPQSAIGAQLPLLDADPADWSLTAYFTSTVPDIEFAELSDHELIAAAQILTDQAVSSTLKFQGESDNDFAYDKALSTRKLTQKLLKATKTFLKDMSPCTMRAFIDIQGIPVLNQGLRIASRAPINPRAPNGSDASKSNNPFNIPPPQLEIRRSDTKLSILPAAIHFWENLGLGPAKGSKDINAVCIYPNLEGVCSNVDIFLDQMRSIYESSRFGSHDRLVTKDLTNGTLPFSVDEQPQNRLQQLLILKDTMSRLGKILSSSTLAGKNILIYFVYPVGNKTLLVQICSAFQHFFNMYRKALSEKKMSAVNELVLQLIPLDFVSSNTSIPVPLPVESFRLAMEVYDRCIDFTSSTSTPAIMLEQPLPRNIDFKVTPIPSASLLQENTCLHVAYAQSIDDRWITAAWTDNRGTQQMSASYCLGRKNESLSTPFSVVANEIWETTLAFISSKKIHWRIMIAKAGVMDPSEMGIWAHLAATESSAQLSLTLITVQTSPSLRLLPSPVTLGPNGHSTNSGITPVSTPQAMQSSVVSPDNASTPRENTAASGDAATEPDNDARLVDYTDQSWGAVLSHRLNNSNSLMETNLALISGYLVKRGGSYSDDPPIVMEVNIVHSEVLGNPRTFHESLLREILGYYRGLGTLVRVRGVVDAIKDVRPWHIAAAEKAVKALYMLM